MTNVNVDLEAFVDKLAEKAGMAVEVVKPAAKELVDQYQSVALIGILSNALVIILSLGLLIFCITRWRRNLLQVYTLYEYGEELDSFTKSDDVQSLGGKIEIFTILHIVGYIAVIITASVLLLDSFGDLCTNISYYGSPLIGLLKML